MPSEKCDCAGGCPVEICCSGGDCSSDVENTDNPLGYFEFDPKCEWSGSCSGNECPDNLDPKDINAINAVADGYTSNFGEPGFADALSGIEATNFSDLSALAKQYRFNAMRVWNYLQELPKEGTTKIRGLRNSVDSITGAMDSCKKFEADLAYAEVIKKK